MSDVPSASNSWAASVGNACGFELPLAAMVRAVCRAAETGSDALYDVMLKVALMVDAAAPTYGMATFSQKHGERPHLKWVEGLDPEETSDAEEVVAAALALSEASFGVRAGDRNICLGPSDSVGRCAPRARARARARRAVQTFEDSEDCGGGGGLSAGDDFREPR